MKIIDTCPEPINKQDFVAYMHGYVALECGDSIKAEKYFVKAEIINPFFWPAFFLHAQLLEQENFIESRKLFIKCAEILEVYIKKEQTEYDFLLEPFSSNYYYKLCCQYLKGRQQ
jgi:chemotaxis protein methyltransferase CheR